MTQSLKPHFSRFFAAEPGRLHFAAHSHHPWPDVTFAAHQQAWLDAATLADEKWDRVFGEVLPSAQREVAATLRLPDPQTLVFAPNTHEFVNRIFSCLPDRARIVTSDSEFHSFERQLRRLEEAGRVEATRVPAEPFATFGDRLVDAARAKKPDLVFFSQVFFNSGAVVQQWTDVVRALPPEPLVVVDGYHGFLAVPTDLSAIAERAFYLAGGYKYAMAGEGACFLHVPPSAPMRPVNTGWFAAFGALEGAMGDRIPYGPGGTRFAGATFDASGLYRLNAVMRWRREQGLTPETTRAYTQGLQRKFLDALPSSSPLKVEQLLPAAGDEHRGQFLTFRSPDARRWTERLRKERVITDAREDRFRIGFGVYQDETDVAKLLEQIARL
ncbi:MAG: aminotransferase class V-fold PLP-dependent enzyme [Myxococcaceae bacterium]|nr:aminotransferase class V-fold PLP-dependent enzyme [Myxococcaceae bacterium]